MKRRSILAALAVTAVATGVTFVALKPAAAVSATLFGVNVNSAHLPALGPVKVYRSFFSGAPGNWTTDARLNHGVPVNVSFKYHPNEVNSGVHDAAIRTFFRTAPTNRTVWWTFFHEPEDDIADGAFTAAAYRQAWQRIFGITQEAAIRKSNVKSALVLMDYTLDPASRRTWTDYYPGDAYVDVMSWDLYSFRETDGDASNNETIVAHQSRRPSLEVTRSRGKAYAISEIGYDDPSTRPAFLTGLARWADANGVAFVTYFDLIGKLGDHRLEDTASQAVWRSAIDGSMFDEPVTVTGTASSNVTRTSATMSCRVDPRGGSYQVAVASWRSDGGGAFSESGRVAVGSGPQTVSSTRSGLLPGTSYTFRCKVYDEAGTLVLKGATADFRTPA